jgi:hypothetical protein
VIQPSASSGSGSGGHTCTGIQNCPRDPVAGLAWTCLLGTTCGFSYRDCNPCPYIGSGSSSSTASSSRSSPSTSSSSGSSPSSSSSAGSSPKSSSASGSSPSPSSSSGSVPSSGSSSPTSSGYRSREGRLTLHCLAAVTLAGVLVIAV